MIDEAVKPFHQLSSVNEGYSPWRDLADSNLIPLLNSACFRRLTIFFNITLFHRRFHHTQARIH